MEKLEKAALLKSELIEKLSELFPQAFVDGKIDFQLLKSLLGQHVEESNEKYQFTWNGKQNAIANAQKPSIGTLREDKQSSKNFANTENLYIEGDNLEVLKLLQKTYQGKIKMIYIDPPYNTGNDFVYEDDYKDNLDGYLRQTNQTNKSNTESDGRFHTKWLNMMYPRLTLAKHLLNENGLIFISIDDKEQANLKKICDEIFGESNQVSIFTWIKKRKPSHLDKLVRKNTEFILVYAKNKSFVEPLKTTIAEDNKPYPFYNSGNNRSILHFRKDKVYFSNNLNNFFKKGDYFDNKTKVKLINDLVVENGLAKQDFSLEGEWRYSQLTLNSFYENDFKIEFKGTNLKPYYIRELIGNTDEMKNIMSIIGSIGVFKKVENISPETLVGTNEDAEHELFEILGSKGLLDYPKPVNLISTLIYATSKSNDFTILDFFSGSGTTAHAVIKLNAEDGGNRKFIMVQLPETTSEDSEAYKAGYKNICEIGKERIRRAGEKIKQEMLEKDPGADVNILDIGFKVFKLDTTNIKPWDGTQEISDGLLDASKDVIKKDRQPLDVVYELMLMYGVFNEPIEEIKINGKTMYSIANHFLMICLFDEINEKDIKEIIKLSPKNIIFNDAGFKDDNVKLNAELTLKNHGVEDIKSL
jgi:adenine-specific DNA-methyltransferase